MELKIAIQKQFGTFHLDVDYDVEGERVGIFGPSGGGKSTLTGLLAGLNHPDRGIILLDGDVIFDSSKQINTPPNRRRISMVFQRPHLFPHLSVRNNLLYGYRRCAPEHRRITPDNLVEVLRIGHLLDRGIRNLSGGERQRVAIGRAILSSPRLLVMDEPLSGLDDNLKFQIIPFLKETCETFMIPYLFISHSLVEMRIMADKVLSMAEGRITGHMTAEDLARSYMGGNTTGYTNLLALKFSRRINGLYAYDWGNREIFVSMGSDQPSTFFELSSMEIILFRRHPEAISARNLLNCRVTNVFDAGYRLGIELECGGERLIAEIVRQAAEDLGITKGNEIFAAIKATAFKRLG
ncbi:MAG: molybdenum ABC transporter ATP-binding protein [Syntrophobacterales bacterium]|jgi:molybdate transport system ATP-binding protein|nr:molybdenum ABC transporter ATP-binding protein [Syntrophobacterales bacterium]